MVTHYITLPWPLKSNLVDLVTRWDVVVNKPVLIPNSYQSCSRRQWHPSFLTTKVCAVLNEMAYNSGAQGAQPRSSNEKDAPLTQEDFVQKPWKYIGYKEFARYISSGDDFLALRRFDRVHSRLLLMLQDQVVELESELDAIDARLSKRTAPDLDNGSIRNDVQERREVLEKLHRRVREYDDLLCQYTTLKSRPRAPQRNIHNIRVWLSDNYSPIHPLEAEFINSPSDLVSLTKAPRSPFQRLVEKCVLMPARLFFASATPQGVESAVDTLASVLVFLAATTMIVAPLWILAMVVEDPFDRLATVTGFLVLFLGMFIWGTMARPFEILAATAGYAAVLVVFLQVGTVTDEGRAKFFDI
ncbi:hypothetical protein V8F20_002451 [Naviculisporaceae sp. PSN 640]